MMISCSCLLHSHDFNQQNISDIIPKSEEHKQQQQF